MKRENYNVLFYLVFIGVMFLIFSTACVRHIDNSDATAGEEEENGASSSLPELEPQNDFIEYADDNFRFQYPTGWLVEVVAEPAGAAQAQVIHLQVKNIDKQIVLGGVAPEDYYIGENGVNVINSEKYADKFILFSVDLYLGSQAESWPDFFARAYPGVVAEHALYQVPYQPEVEGVIATKINGLLFGQPRFFARKSGRVYDFSLHFRGVESDEATEKFNSFLAGFSF